jgi:undecaprenyl pyrophosphate phosphatase UppP
MKPLRRSVIRMDDWRKVIRWATQQEADGKERTREQFKRTLRAWPMIVVAVVPFGWLAFATLDATKATFCTALVVVAAVLVAEHLAG